MEQARRRRADHYRACGALAGLRAARSTRTLGMHSDIVPGSPKDTIQFLVSLDPAFESELEDEDTDSLNHHAVIALFAQYFAANVGGFTVDQLRRLGS